jgi:hypothetical protein
VRIEETVQVQINTYAIALEYANHYARSQATS